MKQYCLYLREHILAYAADWAYPIVRQILEGGTGSDIAVRISHSGIIDVTAGIALILF